MENNSKNGIANKETTIISNTMLHRLNHCRETKPLFFVLRPKLRTNKQGSTDQKRISPELEKIEKSWTVRGSLQISVHFERVRSKVDGLRDSNCTKQDRLKFEIKRSFVELWIFSPLDSRASTFGRPFTFDLIYLKTQSVRRV